MPLEAVVALAVLSGALVAWGVAWGTMRATLKALADEVRGDLQDHELRLRRVEADVVVLKSQHDAAIAT